MIYAVLAVLAGFIVFRILASRPDITPTELSTAIEKGGRLIDVRSASEFRTGHLSGAVNVPVERMPGGLIGMNLSRDTVILLYCASGIRSGRAKRVLRKAGYCNALNVGAMGSLKR